MADTKSPSQVRLQDPLSEVTRNERKVLLGISAIGIVIAKSGLVPSRISALGVDFDHADQAALLRMLSAIVGYFLIAFVIYASSDLVAWRVSFHNAIRDWRRRREAMSEEEQRLDKELMEFLRRGAVWSRATRPASVVRALFEFGVPVVVGSYAIWVLASAPLRNGAPVRSGTGSEQILDPSSAQPNKPLQPTAPPTK